MRTRDMSLDPFSISPKTVRYQSHEEALLAVQSLDEANEALRESREIRKRIGLKEM